MSFWSDLEATFDIGSVDPEAIYDSASACSTLSSDMIAICSALDKAAMGLEKCWQSLGDAQDRSGSAAFQKRWRSFSASIKEYAGHLDTLAAQLNQAGDVVKHAQEQMARLMDVEEASLAIIGIATIVTAGVYLASAEATATAMATGVMNAADAALFEVGTIVDALLEAFLRVSALFTLGTGWDVATIFATRGIQGLNPFDPRNYSVSDWSNVWMAGDMATVFGLAARIPMIKTAVMANPALGEAMYQLVSQSTAGPIWQILILGLPADKWSTWEKVGLSAGISTLTAGLLGSYGKEPSLGQFITEPGQGSGSYISTVLNNPQVEINGGDWARNGVGMPASVIKYALFGASPPASLGEVQDPGSPLAVPVPDIPLPQVPGLPQGSTLHVVQHEESLSEIASGNAALAREIGQLNHLTDAVVQPGQVLIVPPAGTK